MTSINQSNCFIWAKSSYELQQFVYHIEYRLKVLLFLPSYICLESPVTTTYYLFMDTLLPLAGNSPETNPIKIKSSVILSYADFKQSDWLLKLLTSQSPLNQHSIKQGKISLQDWAWSPQRENQSFVKQLYLYVSIQPVRTFTTQLYPRGLSLFFALK